MVNTAMKICLLSVVTLSSLGDPLHSVSYLLALQTLWQTSSSLMCLNMHVYLCVYVFILSARASQMIFLLPFVFNLPEFIILFITIP